MRVNLLNGFLRINGCRLKWAAFWLSHCTDTTRRTGMLGISWHREDKRNHLQLHIQSIHTHPIFSNNNFKRPSCAKWIADSECPQFVRVLSIYHSLLTMQNCVCGGFPTECAVNIMECTTDNLDPMCTTPPCAS